MNNEGHDTLKSRSTRMMDEERYEKLRDVELRGGASSMQAPDESEAVSLLELHRAIYEGRSRKERRVLISELRKIARKKSKKSAVSRP